MANLNRYKRGNSGEEQRQLYLNIAFFSVFACVILIFLLLAFDKIPKAGGKKPRKNSVETEAQTDESETETTIPRETIAAETSITISLMGDCTIGTDENFDTSTNFNAYYTVYGKDHFFKNVKSILSADDLSIVNFEGTLTDSQLRADKTYAFKGDPAYASILSEASIEAANLANNHSSDYGPISYTDTQTNLQGAGITTFGYDETAVVEIKGLKIGLVGICELDQHLGVQTQLLNNIAKVQEEGADYIIVNFHWGTELATVPDANQTTLARAAIDAGADLVAGHHPHVLQGIEIYKGKTIVYSLGNFCFGGNVYPSDFDTMIFQQTITFNTYKEPSNTANTVIPCSVSSESTYNNYQPTPASTTEQLRIEEKLNDLSSQIPAADGSVGVSGTGNETGNSGVSSSDTDTPDSQTDGLGTPPETSENSGESQGSISGNSVQLFLPD